MKVSPAIQERWKMHDQSLGWEDPLQEETVIHSSILTWEIPCTEESGGLLPWGHKELDATERLSRSTSASFVTFISPFPILKDKLVTFSMYYIRSLCSHSLTHTLLDISSTLLETVPDFCNSLSRHLNDFLRFLIL